MTMDRDMTTNWPSSAAPACTAGGPAGAEAHQPVTHYGALSGPVRVGMLDGHRVAFLARHGEGHSLPPHRINYRANLAALQALGAKRVLALNTVGGITERFGPRVLGCPDQLIDYTWGRISTICEEPGTEVLHVDFGEPYTRALRQAVIAGCGQSRRRAGPMAAATAPRRDRAWKRAPKSRACVATAVIWSA